MVYKLDVYCENCGCRSHVQISEGKLVAEARCPVCGCKTLKRSSLEYATKVNDE